MSDDGNKIMLNAVPSLMWAQTYICLVWSSVSREPKEMLEFSDFIISILSYANCSSKY